MERSLVDYIITYIRVSTDLLDNILVEMTGIAHERVSYVEGVLQAEVGLVIEAEERTLLQFLAVVGSVDVLHPAVVSGGDRVVDVLLKHDNIAIWDLLCVCG